MVLYGRTLARLQAGTGLLLGVSPQLGIRNLWGLGQAAHSLDITHLLLNQELFTHVFIGLEA